VISPDVLIGPRLKLNRANRHIDELISVTSPLSPDLYSLALKHNGLMVNGKPLRWDLAYRPKQPIPETLALVIGDAVHNLRAALDHLASGIIRTNDPKAAPYFPVTKTRENLVSSGWLKAMEAALPGTKDLLLVKIRPENDGRDHLWRLGTLDIDDKHNLLTPNIAITSIEMPGLMVGTNRVMPGGVVGNDATREFILVRSDEPITVQGDFYTSVAVTFSEGDLLKDKAIVPTLSQMSELVGETLDAFADLIANQK